MAKLTPIEAANVKNLQLRHPHTVNVRWNYFPHTGNKMQLYTKQKKHMEEQIKWLCVLETNELYKTKLAIETGDVPQLFLEIVNKIYDAKRNNQHVVELLIGNGVDKLPLFDYDDKEKWNNPGIPVTAAVKSKPVELVVSKVPIQPVRSIPPEALKILQQQHLSKRK